MSKNKTRESSKSVHQHVLDLANERRIQDSQWVMEQMGAITKEEPRMWGPTIIGYGRVHYIYESGREGDMPALSFAPRKANLVFYVLNNFEGQEKLLASLGKFKTGKVCLYINKLEDIDRSILIDICKKAYAHTIKTQSLC